MPPRPPRRSPEAFAARIAELERERDTLLAGLLAAIAPGLDAATRARVDAEIRRLVERPPPVERTP